MHNAQSSHHGVKPNLSNCIHVYQIAWVAGTGFLLSKWIKVSGFENLWIHTLLTLLEEEDVEEEKEDEEDEEEEEEEEDAEEEKEDEDEEEEEEEEEEEKE